MAMLTAAAPPPPSADAARYIANVLHLSRYRVAAVDLNADGKSELLVYAEDREFCGTGGCTLFILTPLARSYRVVTTVTITRPPIQVLATSSHGWRDLGVTVAGGGIANAGEACLRFNGTTYPSNPTMSPAGPPSTTRGRTVIE